MRSCISTGKVRECVAQQLYTKRGTLLLMRDCVPILSANAQEEIVAAVSLNLSSMLAVSGVWSPVVRPAGTTTVRIHCRVDRSNRWALNLAM